MDILYAKVKIKYYWKYNIILYIWMINSEKTEKKLGQKCCGNRKLCLTHSKLYEHFASTIVYDMRLDDGHIKKHCLHSMD